MNRVPRKLLPEFAQLQATPAIAQCKRSTARWIRDFLLVSTLCQKQVKLKLQKSDAVLKLLPVPMISRQQRDNLFQDRFGKGRKLLAVAAERAELPDWFQVSPKTACKICTLYFFFPHTPPPPQVGSSCSLWHSETSAEFFLSVERPPAGKARQLCQLSG